MGLYDKVLNSIAERSANKVLGDLSKADSTSMVTPASKPGVLRYTFDPVYVNSNYYNKKKPDSTITFDVLRNFSLKYEIVRACINLRKRQLAGMDWDIVTAETSDTNNYDSDILAVKEFILNLGGSFDENGEIVAGSGSYRRWVNMVIEDLLSLDALALYNQRNRGGEVLTLIPVDGSTIRLMVEGMGTPPPPPAIAYKQVIRGTVTAELTTNDLRYEMLNPRTNSPYGLSPLESLMITVSSALKSGLYNLAYLTDGNIPEGLVEAPQNWTTTQIREFEKNWNAAMAGDDGATRKLHWLPSDSKYVPTKKPDDMAFQEFNDWLMKLTCAMFDVMPIEIGFQPKGKGLGDKGANESQQDIGEDKGLKPIANMVEEILNKVIQIDMGYPHLMFSYTGLQVDNLKEAAEVNETLIFSGQRTINEVRTDDGLDTIEGGDALFIVGQAQPLNQEAADVFGTASTADQETSTHREEENSTRQEAEVRGREADKKPQNNDDGSAGDSEQDFDLSMKTDRAFIQLVTELRTLRKKVRTDFRTGRTMKAFESKVMPSEALSEINLRLSKAKDLAEAEAIINEYRQDYQVAFLANVNKLRASVAGIIGDEQSAPTTVNAG